MGNHRFLINRCPSLRSGEDILASSRRQITGNNNLRLSGFRSPFFMGNDSTVSGHSDNLVFSSRTSGKMACCDGHGQRQVGRTSQRPITLETLFTGQVGARTVETKACHRNERRTNERKQHNGIGVEGLHINWLQSRQPRPYSHNRRCIDISITFC